MRATSPLIKAKVEGNAVVHKRNGALASRTPIGRRTLCLSVIQEAEGVGCGGGGGGGVAKHAMTNDSWNGKEREKNKNGLISPLPPSPTLHSPGAGKVSSQSKL